MAARAGTVAARVGTVAEAVLVVGEERKGARDGRTYVVCGTPEVHRVETSVVRGKMTRG